MTATTHYESSSTRRDEVLFLRALFPYAEYNTIEGISSSSPSIEESIYAIHNAVNPDLYSASFLKKGKPNSTDEKDPPTPIEKRSPTFGMVRRMLLDRSSLLEESHLVNISLNYEYNETIIAFPIDTAAWDKKFLAAAAIPDLVGGRALSLPRGAEASGVAAALWANAASLASMAGSGWNTPATDTPPPSLLEEADEAVWKARAAAAEKAAKERDRRAVPSPLEFGERRERQWRHIMAELQPWADVFADGICSLCEEVTAHCPTLVEALPDLIPRLLRAIGQELQGIKVTPPLRNEKVDVFGGYLVTCNPIFVRDMEFGRSYGRFTEDGTSIMVRVKVRRIAFEPVAFSYVKTGGRTRRSSGEMEVSVKDVIVKALVTATLAPSGRTTISCIKPHVSVGVLKTMCSITKLRFVIALLKPMIRRRLCQAIKKFLNDDIVMGTQ